MAQQTRTITCDSGHIVTVGNWIKTDPVCVLCKITEKTEAIAGYTPKFESRRWEPTALTFIAYCQRGHQYEASLNKTAPCTVCRRAEHIEEDSGFEPTLVANYTKCTKFRCHAGHLFMADDRTTGCPGCKCAETINAAGGRVRSGTTTPIFWGRNTYVKFTCDDCGGVFYSCQDEIKKYATDTTASPLTCPHEASAVSRTIKVLENYYSAPFDEQQMINDGVFLRVCGYNARKRTAVIHTAGLPVDAAATNWCEMNGVRLFTVSATATVDIEKTLARQISECEGVDYDTVIERMGAARHNIH